MLSSGLVTLRCSCVSSDLCKRFTLGNTLQQHYNGRTRLPRSCAIRYLYASSTREKPALNRVLKQSEAEPKFAIEKVVPRDVKNLDHHPSSPPGDAQPGAQETLPNTNTSDTTQAMDKAKLEQLRKHIKGFFAGYQKFNYDPTKPYTEEFIRMVEEFKWAEDSKKYKTARKRLNTASVLQFNENFDSKPKKRKSKSEGKKKSESGEKMKSGLGDKKKEFNSGDKKRESESGDKKEGKNLRKWVELFNRIDIKDPVMPKTIREFKKRVKSVHTNICDVLDADVIGKKATDWGNEVILSEYTCRTKKIFPRNHRLAGTLLRHLLRHIISPSPTRGFEETEKEST
ncbi:hypothetical protein FRC11_009256 [Ceratobasidium sp. 423]|nr:hypothetical protein FRC11_009256 [Ceratobasidium sp. 423]